jgi:parallel beta-helix repeat protein
MRRPSQQERGRNGLQGLWLTIDEPLINHGPEWREYDVEIANNTVSQSGLYYINVRSLGAPAIHLLHRAGGDGGVRPHRDVTIRDNQMSESGDLGVLVEDAANVTVTNNDLSGLNQLPLDHVLG